MGASRSTSPAKAQYFIGAFNGKTFTADDKPYVPPAGTLIGDGGFEGADYGNWTATGAAFGTGPAHSTTPTNGAIGNGWVDSFGSADSDTGTLTSPTFTINQNYINFLIAGGNHPYVPGGLTAPPAGTTIEDFEGDSLPGWTGTGDFVGITPSKENHVRPGRQRGPRHLPGRLRRRRGHRHLPIVHDRPPLPRRPRRRREPPA